MQTHTMLLELSKENTSNFNVGELALLISLINYEEEERWWLSDTNICTKIKNMYEKIQNKESVKQYYE
jgi:hypothetical protein